jgi:DNA polymerase-3 subunit gamma/tau
LLSHLRILMLLPHAPEVALAEVGSEERPSLVEQANSIPTAEVVRLIETLGGTLGRIKRGGDPKLELELSFLKLTRDYAEPSVENLVRRLEAIEFALEHGSVARAPERLPEETSVDETEPEIGESTEIKDEPADEEPEDATKERPELAAQWGSLMQDLRDGRQAPAAAVYEEARVEGFDGSVLEISFPDELSIYVKLAREARHADPLREAIARRFGVNPRIECRVSDGASDDASRPGKEPQRQTVDPMSPGDELPSSPEARFANEEPVGTTNAPEVIGTEDLGSVSGGREGDDKIRDQREVFEMARKRFGSRDPDGGS